MDSSREKHSSKEATSNRNYLRQLSIDKEKEVQRERESRMSKRREDTIRETKYLHANVIAGVDINSFKRCKEAYTHLHRNAYNIVIYKDNGQIDKAAEAYFSIKTAYHNEYPNEVKEYCKLIGLTSL